MLGRKRTSLESQRPSSAKERRWRQELEREEDDALSSDADKITPEELEQWRRHEAVVGNMTADKAYEDESQQERSVEDDSDKSQGHTEERNSISPSAKRHRKRVTEIDSEGSGAMTTDNLRKQGQCPASCQEVSDPTPSPPPIEDVQPIAAPFPQLPLQALASADERFIGRIKRYTDMAGGGGYGFIDCDEGRLRFGRDVYIHKNQMQGLTVGDEVTFTITRNFKGEPQARHVMRLEDTLRAAASTTVAAGGLGQPTGLLRGGPLGSLCGTAESLEQQATKGLMDEQQAKRFQASLRTSR